jgi:ferric-dicitrate binding protein FerR (iron transport regulator)
LSKPQYSVDEEAVLWFAKLRRGVMTLEERAGFEAWRLRPENATAMAELEHVWQSLEIARDRLGPIDGSPRRVALARTALVAAACVICLGIGIISYSGDSSFWTKLDWVER